MVSSDTNCPVAEVPAPPAVIVVTPADVIVPAKVPATPPDVVVVLPSNGNAATTPPDTDEVAVTSSPSIKVSDILNADPTVFNSSADEVYPTAVPEDNVPNPPKDPPSLTFKLFPLTV